VHLDGLDLLSALPRAFLAGRDRDLLEPLEFLEPYSLPREYPGEADRRTLAVGLAEANASYGHPLASELAAKLADPATAVVVTGQQPGLFGGPLYTLSKAVAASRWAAELEAAGRPAVAVFWIATEDHDYRESAWCAFQTAAGPRRFDLGADTQGLMPMGMRSLGPAVDEILRELRAAVPGDRFAEWCDTLEQWYRPTARFGEAFARLLAHLLGDRCPLLLDAMLPATKQAQRRVLASVVERRIEVESALTDASTLVTERGYPLQVKPQPGASPLFFLHGGERRRIVWQGEDSWSLRGREDSSRPVGELLAAVVDNPSVVMPGVLVRPVVQDAILGSTLQVMGPGEMSYLPQLARLYDVLEVPAPATALRPQLLVMPDNQRRKLEAAGLELEELVRVDFDLDRAAAGARSDRRLEPAGRALDALLAELDKAAEPVASEVGKALEKTGAQMRRGLEQFESRLTAALGRADEVRRRRLEGLRDWVRPAGKLQERMLSTADLPGRYGGELVDALFEQLALDGGRLGVISVGGGGVK
jgi:bacillithiol biosynthesis cysteine-adding enzyme BshC